MSVWTVNKEDFSPINRHEGIDLFRVIAAYGIILLHFEEMGGHHPSHSWLIQFRDYSFPFFVMSSFFVLTISFVRNPSRNFWQFLKKRLVRIWIPFLIWTILYWSLSRVSRWVMYGETISFPSLALFVCGYAHLWYLQFIFVGSLLIEPLLRCIGRKKDRRWKLSLFCLSVGFLYPFFFEPLFHHSFHFERLFQVNEMLKVGFGGAYTYHFYIPLGVGVALLADKIVFLYHRPMFRVLSLVIIGLSMAFHFGTSSKITREVYSLAVFVALLGPLPRISLNGIREIAKYSYGIYILHLLMLGLVEMAIRRAGIEFTMGVLFCGSGVVFGLSLLGTIMLRKLFPYEWFLPLIPVSYPKSVFQEVEAAATLRHGTTSFSLHQR